MGKTQVRFVFLAAITAVVFVFAANPFGGGGGQPPPAALAAPGPGDTVNAGYDLFETESGETDLLGIDLEVGADFFGPGSDPFDGRVYYEGVPIPSYQPPSGPVYTELGPTSMIVHRPDDVVSFPATSVPIEIVALSLKSVDPITVTYGEDPSKQWDVTAVVPENDVNQTPGSMDVSHEYATGGTFDSYLPVDPLLTFTEVGGPGVVGPDYYSSLPAAVAIDFYSVHVPWNHTANPLASPAYHWVIVKEGLTSNFFPGIDGTSGLLYKGYFSLDDTSAPEAHLAVQPAELVPGETVGDCSNRPSEVATGTDTFNSTASMYVDLPGVYTGWIDLEGDTIVERNPDPQEPGVIDIEIIEMSLVSTAPITVTAGSGLGLPATTGEVRSASGGDDFPADSFFDVYVQIDASGMGGGIYHNIDAVRMETTLNPDLEGVVCLPPYEHVFAASNVPVDLWEGETLAGTLDDATHIPEPPRSITVVKLDEVTEAPLPGAVFTLHKGTDCDNPALAAATTDYAGVGDLGPMGGGIYSVKEVIAPVGSDLPYVTCTDVDHTYVNVDDYYTDLEVTKGGPDVMGGLDSFPTAAKIIMDITDPPIGEVTVVLNGLTEVERQPLIADTIETEIISMNLVGEHPVVGTVTVVEDAVEHSYGSVTNPIIDDKGTPEPEDDILTYGDAVFWVYVDVDVPSMGAQWENLAPVTMQTHIEGIPPELAFFESQAMPVDMHNRVGGLKVGEMQYALHITLPRGEKAVIMQDPPYSGPPEQISYSIEFNSASNIGSPYIHAADIVAPPPTSWPPGPTVVRTCASLGLSGNGCALASPQDDLNSLSYGFDFSSADPAEPPKVFSVEQGSNGLLGTDVDIEVTCSTGAEAHADLFRTPLDGTNQQEFDGNGSAGAPDPTCLASYPLGLVEPFAPSAGDNLNALGELPDGDPVYFTLAPNSPSLLPVASGGLGLCGGSSCSSAHIFKSTGGVVSIYATPADLGLVSGDVVNALALRESDGLFDVAPADGVFDKTPDLLQFSLAPGSPSLTSGVDSAADQFEPKTTAGGSRVLVTGANAHGLMNAVDMGPYGDNLDAIKAPYLDSDGDGVPDPIDTGGYTFDDGTISGSFTGTITVTDLTNSVQVEASGSGSVDTTCPATVDSDITDIALTLPYGGEIAVLGCESSASVTIVNGPTSVGFGPFTATVPTGSKVVIRQLPSPAAGPCGGTVPAGAYQITHSVGTLDVIISSGAMSPVTLPPGGVYRDCDGDAIFGAVDNCTDDSNPPQTNTDVDLSTAGATVAGVPLLTDTAGDVCDSDQDNDSFDGTTTATQTPGPAATGCPGGVVDIWADCVESYLGTDLDDNCNGAPGAGTDAWPPDVTGNGQVSGGDVFAIFPSWLGSTPRHDLDASGTVSGGDVFSVFPWWLISCS